MLEKTEGLNLEKIFELVESLSGLEVSIYSLQDTSGNFYRSIKTIPFHYRKHMSDFCRIIKANKTGKGCAGYDSMGMTRKAAETGKPFVNICHAGVAEVIFPVFGATGNPIASVHIGQAVTEEIEEGGGFNFVLEKVRCLGVDEKALKKAYDEIPRMSSEKLLNLGQITDLAIRGLASKIGPEAFEYEIKLNRYPAIKKALEIISECEVFEGIDQDYVAKRVFLNTSYFCRLFKKVLGCNFSEFLIKRKLSRASSLLHTTDMSIMEITLFCGYTRQSYFASMFKKYTGMTPLEYRKNKHKTGPFYHCFNNCVSMRRGYSL